MAQTEVENRTFPLTAMINHVTNVIQDYSSLFSQQAYMAIASMLGVKMVAANLAWFSAWEPGYMYIEMWQSITSH